MDIEKKEEFNAPNKDGESIAKAITNNYKKLAEQGDAEAQYNLALSYENGEGIEKNLEEAIKWYKKAIEQGYDKAQNVMAIFYEKGVGVEKNFEEAVNLYRKAAEQGYNKAQYNLARCYEKGIGVEKNDAEAISWYEKMLESDDVHSIDSKKIIKVANKLAIYYFTKTLYNENNNSVGLNLNSYEKALNYFTYDKNPSTEIKEKILKLILNLKFNMLFESYNSENIQKLKETIEKFCNNAINYDSVDILIEVGEIYEEGLMIAKNEEKALEFYKKAAKLTDKRAYQKMVKFYDRGIGVEKNNETKDLKSIKLDVLTYIYDLNIETLDDLFE